MRTLRDAEAAWRRARDLCAMGDAAGAIDLAVEVGASYERGRFYRRAEAAGEALDRLVVAGEAAEVWAVLDDFQLGPGEMSALLQLEAA